jgi:hypothetical protein
MAKAFAGKMSHDDFFIKYEPYFDIAKRFIMDDLDSKIWNRYVDLNGYVCWICMITTVSEGRTSNV